ncbi:MAG: hypothetical protein V9E98_03010 [Candidatus Nanopelagicales bacterium]
MIAIGRVVAAGELTWWLNATLCGCVSPDMATEHVRGRVTFPGEHGTTWPLALGALRRRQVRCLHIRYVEPGDPLGLPGPAEVSKAAVAAGLALVTDSGAVTVVPVTAMPDIVAAWVAVESTPTPDSILPLGTLREARGLMREAMAEVTATLTGLPTDERALAAIAAFRDFTGPVPPPRFPPEAAQVADAALRVWWLTSIAGDLAQRRSIPLPAAVTHLRPLARRAASVAFSERPA